MLLAYVDESYTDDWFAMAALLVDGPAAVAPTQELDGVAAAAAKVRARIGYLMMLWRQWLGKMSR